MHESLNKTRGKVSLYVEYGLSKQMTQITVNKCSHRGLCKGIITSIPKSVKPKYMDH